MGASSMAYTTILSIIPALALSFSIFKAFGGMDKLYAGIEPVIIENLAEGSDDEAIQFIRHFIENAHAGAVGFVGFVGLAITCTSLLYSAEKMINGVWGIPLTRSWWRRLSAYGVFIIIGPLAAAVIVGAATSTDLPAGKLIPGALSTFVLSVGFFSLVYKYVPHRKVQWRPALISGAIVAVAWDLARAIYSLYAKHMVSYNHIYGSLAAVPILLLWIYIVWVVILTGAALSAAIQMRYDPAP